MELFVRTSLILLALTSLPHSAATQSQALPPLDRGTDLRLWAPSLGFAADRVRFISWGDTSISVTRDEPFTDTVAVPLDAVTRLDAFEGQSKRRAVERGAAIGVVVGAVIGAVNTPCGTDDPWCGIGRFYYGSIGVIAGSAVGALIGSLFSVDVWVRQELPRTPGP